MPLARPHSSKPSSRQARHCSRVFLPRVSWWFVPAVVEGWQGSGYRTSIAFGIAFRHSGASFNPARAFLRVLFYWKGDLVPRFRREQYFRHHEAETPSYQCHLAAAAPIPCGRASGTPDQRRLRKSIGAFQSRPSVSTRLPFISKGEYVFLFRREQSLRKNWVPSTVSDATCCCCGCHASPEDARMGRRIGEFRFVIVSVPAARSGHCSYRCGYTTFLLLS